MIPHICPELPETQIAALRYAKKVPLVYTNVFVKQWTAFEKLKVNNIASPGMWHASTNLDFPVSLGGYTHTKSPDRADRAAHDQGRLQAGPAGPAQHVAGRAELLRTSFETIERGIRDQLGRMLGGGGFDPGRRHPGHHGEPLAARLRLSVQLARRSVLARGRRAAVRGGAASRSAASPSPTPTPAAYAYTDAAIDQAHRAVEELTAKTS